MSRLYTFGDSILDSAHFNEAAVTPGGLMAKNDDALFPEFRGRDLRHYDAEVALKHCAEDGATASCLRHQMVDIGVQSDSVVLLTVGGNDLLRHLAGGSNEWLVDYTADLRDALTELSAARVFVGNVYDPSFGDDTLNPFDSEPAPLRRMHARLNETIATETARAGAVLVDLHGHFLTGSPAWLTRVIEPSLVGASEVRRAFLTAWELDRASI